MTLTSEELELCERLMMVPSAHEAAKDKKENIEILPCGIVLLNKWDHIDLTEDELKEITLGKPLTKIRENKMTKEKT